MPAAVSGPKTTVVDFGAHQLPARVVSGSTEIATRSVVVNLADCPATIGGAVPGVLPPGQSTILRDTSIHGEHILVIAIGRPLSPGALRTCGWYSFYGEGAATELLRSPQTSLGERELDLGAFLASPWGSRERYEVRVNLWFAPEGTSCGIHDQHDFLEFHTQVWGIGVMQKFSAADASLPYEEQALAPGSTGAAPFCPATRSDWAYPWHQYAAHTDSVWLAVEYHATHR